MSTKRRRRDKLAPRVPPTCRSCAARIRWATDDLTDQRRPLDLGTVTVGPRYVVTRAGNVDVAILLVDAGREGHPDHRSTCLGAAGDEDDIPRQRRDCDG